MQTTEPLLLRAGAQLRRRIFARVGGFALAAVASASVFAVLFIFLFIARDAVPFFVREGFREFFTGAQWHPSGSPPRFGALPILFGTLYVTLLSSLIAVPFGICAAVCISDMLGTKLRDIVKTLVEILAAIPSVAYGFFALVVVAPWMQSLGVASGANALNVSLVLALMALPTIVSLAEDALRAVPRDLREASFALGSTRAETLLRVVIPSARGGICAACLLGVMRALGETMVVWMASGNSAKFPKPWYNVFDSVRTLTATIVGEMGEADHATASSRYSVLFAMALCLLIFSLIMNTLSGWLVRRAGRVRK